MRDVQMRNRVTVERERGEHWTAQALCAIPTRRPTTTDDPWYSRNASDKEYAKTVCGKCPVQRDCAEAGQNEKHGIWAGVDKDTPTPYIPRIPRPDNCHDCRKKLRPRKTRAADYPGTVVHHGRGLCQPCYRDQRDKK